jgi:hypothetical protein
MFSMSKETIMMVAIAVALFAIFYVHREVQSTKLELQKLSTPVPVPLPAPTPVLAPVVAPKSGKKKESADEVPE